MPLAAKDDPDKIFNPASGRYVLRTGPIGRRLVAASAISAEPPKDIKSMVKSTKSAAKLAAKPAAKTIVAAPAKSVAAPAKYSAAPTAPPVDASFVFYTEPPAPPPPPPLPPPPKGGAMDKYKADKRIGWGGPGSYIPPLKDDSGPYTDHYITGSTNERILAMEGARDILKLDGEMYAAMLNKAAVRSLTQQGLRVEEAVSLTIAGAQPL